MKLIIRYAFMTLIIIQGLFVFLYQTNYNFLGILSWIGVDNNFSLFKFLSPLLIYSFIKIIYWIADPISELFNIILSWVVVFGILYLLYWLFLVN